MSLKTTANGNAGTCRYIFNEVINRYAPEDNLYLLEDRDVWKYFSQGTTPHDFFPFVMLTGQDDMLEARRFAQTDRREAARLLVENYLSERRKRCLISPLPSLSTHTEVNFLAPLIDWTKV